jgi:hypothetical protein
MAWTEASIGHWLCRHTFHCKLLVVPNCYWTGDECDLLAVTADLRLVDIEIKISRADLKADREKDKWWDRGFGSFRDGKWVKPPATEKQWPRRIWKHYYCLPAAIWKPELLDAIPKASGVLLLEGEGHTAQIRVARKVTACRDAKPIDARDAISIARLAGLRMWDALQTIERIENAQRQSRLFA